MLLHTFHCIDLAVIIVSMSGTDQKKQWKSKRAGLEASVLGDGVFERIEDLIKSNQSEDEGDLNTEEIHAFFTKGFGAQAIQTWSFYSQSSDSGKYTVATIRLTKFIQLLARSADTVDHAVEIIKEVLTSYQKTLYRALTAHRASITNPTLKLVNEIVILNNGALLDDFFALFDFTLPVLPKLLQPAKFDLKNKDQAQDKEHLTIRYCFIRLLLNIIKYSPPLLRKDFIFNNSKLISVWFKHISSIDSDSLIGYTLMVWDDKIVKEQSFKRATKLKFFNEWNFPKLVPLYYTLKDESVKQKFNEFMINVCTDSKYGLKFPQDETWFIGQAPPTAPIQVNGKSFKANNRLLYTVLSSMKAWDDEMQLRTTVEILQETPELIPAFTNYLASRGLHDPKLTSYWIGQTYLLSKIIRSNIPKDIEDYNGAAVPSKYTVAELIIPSVLNRSVLTKCLQADLLFVRQLSLQLIVDILQKLEKVIRLYEEKNWLDAKVEIINYVYAQLPELSAVTTCLNDSYNKKPENKILLAVILMTLNGYSLFNDAHNYSAATSKPFLDVINSKSFSPLDLVLLDNFFQLQDGETSQLKWWNNSENSLSLFTSLVKLASSTESVRSKITSLLSNLMKQTVVLNYGNVKEDPILVLIYSLAAIVSDDDLDGEQSAKIWKLLDESVSRCVRTPFKYLDQSNQNERISPLILAIFEQWKFVDKKTSFKLASEWLLLFVRYLIIIGEPSAILLKLLNDIELDCKYNDHVFEESYEASIQTLHQGRYTGDASVQFFEFITTAPFKEIMESNGIPVSDLDVIGALSRVLSIVSDKSTSLKKSQEVLSTILSKVGNYWFTHPESMVKFSSDMFWNGLYLRSPEEKAIYVSNVLAEVFSQLVSFDQSDFSNVVVDNLSKNLTEGEQTVVGESLWALSNENLRGALSNQSLIIKSNALKLMKDRRLTLHSTQLAELLRSKRLVPILNEFILDDLVIFNDFTRFFKSIIDIEGTLPIFKSLSKIPEVLSELIQFALLKHDPIFITFIATSLNSQTHADFETPETLNSILLQAKIKARELISKEDFTQISFNELLNIFTYPGSDVSDEEKNTLITYALTKASNKYTPEIARLISTFGFHEEPIVKTWVNKCILYLTKIYAEVPELPLTFINFVTSFKILCLHSNLSKILNRANLNALLEVIFSKWITDEGALELASVMVIISTKQLLDFRKLLQILVNNQEVFNAQSSSQKSKFYTAVLISKLFDCDAGKNSVVAIQDKLLTFYNGTTRPEDLLLFSVLEKIERQLSSSWIDDVYNWEFLDLLNESEEELIGNTKLIEKKKEGYLITLNKKLIVSSLKNYAVDRPAFPKSLSSRNSENWEQIQEFYSAVDLQSPAEPTKLKYDTLFLSLLIINNDELVQFTKDEESGDMNVKSNMKKLIESGLLGCVMINLASLDESVQRVSRSILGSLLNSVKDERTSPTFKDRHIFELFLTKILYTYTLDEYSDHHYTPLILISITNLIPVLLNPGHMLFEKAYRWVLQSPSLRAHEIPLYRDIITISSGGEESEIYYKQVTWLLNTFIVGAKTKRDVQLLRNKNIFEWLLNLLNSPYTSIRIRYLVFELISTLQAVEDGGDAIITRFGGLCNIEQSISSLLNDIADKKDIDELLKEQELLNLRQLALKFGILLKSKKRLIKWADDDAQGFGKRTLGQGIVGVQ